MAEKYGYGGSEGAVNNEAYCMPSMQKSNTQDMNMKSGYYDMSNLANTKHFPVDMGKERKNMQKGPEKAPDKY